MRVFQVPTSPHHLDPPRLRSRCLRQSREHYCFVDSHQYQWKFPRWHLKLGKNLYYPTFEFFVTNHASSTSCMLQVSYLQEMAAEKESLTKKKRRCCIFRKLRGRGSQRDWNHSAKFVQLFKILKGYHAYRNIWIPVKGEISWKVTTTTDAQSK